MIWQNLFCRRQGGSAYRKKFIYSNDKTKQCKRQDHLYIQSCKTGKLYAVYETTERKFWRELAKCNQEEFEKGGTEGKCIEARELIIALPESFRRISAG